jgi:cleavage stimulation factor subunit 3
LRNHASQPGYAKAYLEFLTSLGDSTNIRALYERALASIPGTFPLPTCSSLVSSADIDELADSVFVKYLEFEALHGELADVLKVEQRRTSTLRKVRREAVVDEQTGSTLSDLVVRGVAVGVNTRRDGG